MIVKKEVITRVMIDDKRTLIIGDTVKFIANGICHFGMFVGVTTKGALRFTTKVNNNKVAFNVMPKSITEIEVIEHNAE